MFAGGLAGMASHRQDGYRAIAIAAVVAIDYRL